MGLIKKLLGGIFALIGGIFGAIGGIVGLSKKSEYFMEADDAKSVPATPAVAEANGAVSGVKVVEGTPQVAAATAIPAASLNGKSAESVAASAVAAPAKAEAKAAAAPRELATASTAPQTFAPDYLLAANSRSSRRRPGPSLNPYLDMAKKMKPQG
jgi:hypothetical protein